MAASLASVATLPIRAKPRGREIALILAPSNLGLRPHGNGAQQGAWRAPAALLHAGLRAALEPASLTRLDRPVYVDGPQAGSRIRNASKLRQFSVELGTHVAAALDQRRFPVVIGGDCSNLLGCLLGARQRGRVGLIHVDGHSDYFHPGNYDTASRLGSAAGMDLALATGTGEPVLTRWPAIAGPLVSPKDALQIGERDSLTAEFKRSYADIAQSGITQLIMQDVLAIGVEEAANRINAFVRRRRLNRVWLHVDFDVLDQTVMPAVDSPGTPGLNFSQLATLIRKLDETGRIAGVDFAIYDPELDPGQRYAAPLVRCIAQGIGSP